MTPQLKYISFGLVVLFLAGIGFMVDRVGGFAIRTDDISSAVTLSFPQPIIRGVPIVMRWTGQKSENIPVELRLISQSGTVSLGTGKLFAGSMRVTFACALPSESSRLELIDASSKNILASSPVTILPAGPDCVR